MVVCSGCVSCFALRFCFRLGLAAFVMFLFDCWVLCGLAVAGVAYCLCVVWWWIWILIAAFD